MSQNDLADKLGISRSSYQYYERGERDLPASLLLKICEAFNDDAHRILTGAPSPLILARFEYYGHLLAERLEDLDVEINSEARYKIISKVLKDDFRLRPINTETSETEEIDSLLRMFS